MKGLFIICFGIGAFCQGCYHPTPRATVALKCHLYVENIEVNPLGVNEVRLTDSTNFRIFVGKRDVELESFTFICERDSVVIYKKAEDATGIGELVVENHKKSDEQKEIEQELLGIQRIIKKPKWTAIKKD